MNIEKLTTAELIKQKEFYRATVAAYAKAGKTLKTCIETREAWETFKRLAAECFRRRQEMRFNPHIWN